ncbi:MAG: heat shock protein HspQ [Immundisolibacteraceae bacterium]|nr:heat shock protein HspQ [Immundisolibacteraceae bacterium]
MATIIDFPTADFSVGDIVHHKLFDYRGVVVDVDSKCQATDEWYEHVARSRPPRDKPWYHVLVDGSDHSTYVAQQNLEPDGLMTAIHHPLVEEVFAGLENGRYIRKDRIN